MSQLVIIKVFHKNQQISVKQFAQDQIIIGQQSDVSLVLKHKDMAPVHCVIERRDDGSFFLSDLGSEAGTEVNDQKVLETELKHEDVISIGDLRLHFYIGIPSPTKTNINLDEIDKKIAASTEEEEKAAAENVAEDAVEDEDTAENEAAEGEATDSEPVADSVVEVSQAEEEPEEEIPVAPTSTQSDKDVDTDHELQKVSAQTQAYKTDPAVRVGVDDGLRNEPEDGIHAPIFNTSAPRVPGGTYAPTSKFVDLDEVIDVNSRGSVVEVMLTWKERIIGTYHFSQKQKLTLGNRPDCDLQLSVLDFKHDFINIDNGAQIRIPGKMDGFLYRGTQRIPLSALREAGQMPKDGDSYLLNLAQGEMVRCFLVGDKVQAYVSYVEQTPKALSVPMFDFTPSELVAIGMSFILSALIAIYMTFFTPNNLDEMETLMEDQYRVAVIEFNPPPNIRMPEPELEEPEIDPPQEEKVVTQVSEKAAQKTVVPKTKVDRTKKPQERQSLGKKGPKAKNVADKKGAPKELAPNKETKKADGIVSNRPGGAVGTGKEGANAESKKKDVTKSGLLSVISSGGASTNLDKVYEGAGTTFGLADSATGHGGQESSREGEGLGTDLKNVGRGGKGSATVGVSGVTSRGRGGGDATYGGDGGLGDKGRMSIINVEGNSGEFVSTIDKEAVKRVIQRNRSAIKSCYDVELTRNPNLAGKIVLQWEIVNGGRVRNPKVKSSDVSGRTLASCIINRIRVLKFPDPGPNEIAQVAFPFVFEAR